MKAGAMRKGMSRKRKRLLAVLGLVAGLGVAVALVLSAYAVAPRFPQTPLCSRPNAAKIIGKTRTRSCTRINHA